MLDAGADYSLVSASRLRQDTLQQLSPVTTGTCRGVDSKQVEIAGELWRDIEIGGTLVTQHRFLVVKGLVVPLILGADFLARLGEVTFDFPQGKLFAKNTGVRVDMVQHYTGETIELATLHARLASDVGIPGLCEQFVLCYADGLRAKHDYLLEPLRPDDAMVKPAHAVVVPDRDDEIWVRVANVYHGQETLRRGEYLATLYPDVQVSQNDRPARKPVTGYAVGPDITTEQRTEIEALITEYSDVMWQQGDTLPVVSVQVEHAIRLKPGVQPSSCRPRRLSQTEEEEVRMELDDLLRQGLIETSSSPWSAAIVCARRKGGRLRLAIDYRALNAKSIPCSQHPIPRIDDLLDRLGEATFFTTLDLKSGYHQMPVRKEDRELTSFVVPWGQYQWRRGCPFGLSGAPSSFQRLMSVVLGDSQYTDALCYLDDILVWGRDWREHYTRLERVLGRIRAAGMLLAPSKCVFATRKVEYLGHVIEGGCVRIHEDRVTQLRNLPQPRDVHELRRALGGFAYVQRWLPGMAEIATPLYAALDKDKRKKLVWDAAMVTAFEALKQQVANAVALTLPNFNQKFVLVTDASDTGVGAMLANRSNSGGEAKLAPIAFFHHALSPEQSRYSTTEKELLAVVLDVRKFRVYLGRPFDLITDRRALRWLNTLDPHDQNGRRGRWIELLQQYEINPIHKAGKSPELSMADYLSRVGANGGLVAAIQNDSD